MARDKMKWMLIDFKPPVDSNSLPNPNNILFYCENQIILSILILRAVLVEQNFGLISQEIQQQNGRLHKVTLTLVDFKH